MIAVIADDFTGAAEIGGIAIRHGFKTVIDTKWMGPYEAEVLIIAANTRAETPEQAQKTIERLTRQLLGLHPEFIYKKIDSVLRGNVGVELLAQLTACGKNRSIIVPSNPSINRIIKDGVYYCNGAPLDRSSFAVNDTTNVGSSKAIDLIEAPVDVEKTVVTQGDLLPLTGLLIGNCANEEELDYWAGQLDEKTVMAGGASFFNALLKRKKTTAAQTMVPLPAFGKQRVMVCGSGFEASRAVVAQARKDGQFVSYAPRLLFSEGAAQQQLMMEWEEEIIRGLETGGSTIIAIDVFDAPPSADLSRAIGEALADVVHHVMQRVAIQELIIEGGATASAILKKLNYTKFYPTQELALGVIRMKVDGNDEIFVTLKPGSYQWPETLWNY
jgi:uncharacterized protein YgbK (DUF1537 family)